MLHEILLALAGHAGNVISANAREGDAFQVDDDFPFLQESERAAINQVCKLGHMYKALENFARHYSSSSSLLALPPPPPVASSSGPTRVIDSQPQSSSASSFSPSPDSVYLRALRRGIEQLLDSYRLALSRLEQHILSNPLTPLSHIVVTLQDYYALFPHLLSLIQTIDAGKHRGGALLSLLHSKSTFGLPLVQSVMQRLLAECNRVLLSQITAWMVFGILTDPAKEFFIQPSLSSSSPPPAAPSSSSLPSPSSSVQSLANQSNNSNSNNSWHASFSLRIDMLPSYITAQVAEKILFAGKAVQVLQSQHQQKIGTNGKNEKAPPVQRKETLSLAEMQLYAESMKALERPELGNGLPHALALEVAVNRIRSSVAGHLFRLVVVDARLKHHLQSVKDYFLLSKGDFYQCFIEDVLAKWSRSGQVTDSDLRLLYNQAALRSSAEDDDQFKRVRITRRSEFDPSSASSSSSSVPLSVSSSVSSASSKASMPLSKQPASLLDVILKELQLEYELDWPLHLIFHQEVFERYKTLFRFLLALRFVQLRLHQTWAIQMRCRNHSKRVMSQLGPIWQLRQHMQHIIDNLLFYLQADVIDTHHALLCERIERLEDFEAVKRAHEEYVSSLCTQSFVNVKVISTSLHNIFEQCLKLSNLIFRAEATLSSRAPLETCPIDISIFEGIKSEFERNSQFLFTMLSGSKAVSSPHVSQLVLRFDFNKFFSSRAIYRQPSAASAGAASSSSAR